jgi:hypothetical protein
MCLEKIIRNSNCNDAFQLYFSIMIEEKIKIIFLTSYYISQLTWMVRPYAHTNINLF